MPLTPGTRIGIYEVTGPLGAGGMGEVHRARDTALDRDVALKVLPEAFTADPERRARFEREAKVLASLNHPNIAQIYGFEESGESRALVLELVEGPTVADLIERGPSPSTTPCRSRGRSPRPSRRRTRPAWCTATSSRPTSRCAGTGPSRCSTSASRRRSSPSPRPTRTCRSRPPSPSRPPAWGWSWGRRPTCRPSRPRAPPSVSAPTSGRSASCSTRCWPASACSAARRCPTCWPGCSTATSTCRTCRRPPPRRSGASCAAASNATRGGACATRARPSATWRRR